MRRLILGLGNRLMSDDAAGALVVERLAALGLADARVCDGGTAGLNLLPEIEDCDEFIAVDAANFGAAPGTVRVFENEAMDRQLGGRKSSAHEVALADLMSSARLLDALPVRRALVAVQPDVIAVGLEPTVSVAAAIPLMVEAILALLARWRTEAAAA